MMKKRKPGAAVVVLALAMLTATVAFGRPAAGSLSVAAPARVAMMSIRGTKMVQGFFRKLVGAYVLARFVVTELLEHRDGNGDRAVLALESVERLEDSSRERHV